jgi:hypothetical protein
VKRLLLALLAAGACHNPSAPADDAALGPRPGPILPGPAPIVIGTTLDARSAKPLAGVVVRGPGGVEARSDAQGRFLLRGLPLGAEGELVATTEAGLVGRNRLRALEGGAIEVVLYLR